MIQLEGDRNAVGQKYFASSFVMLQRIYSRNNLNFLNLNRPSPLMMRYFWNPTRAMDAKASILQKSEVSKNLSNPVSFRDHSSQIVNRLRSTLLTS